MNTIIFLIIIAFATFLQTTTGFGFSIMATPFLLMLFEPQDAIQINLVLSLFISLILLRKIFNEVDWGMFKRLVIGSIIGLPFGLLIFITINVQYLKLIVGSILLLLTILLLKQYTIETTKRKDGLIGFLSGILTTSIGMPGPPLLIYFAGAKTSKEKVRSTTLAFYLFIYPASLLTQMFSVTISKQVWISSVIALPVFFLSLFLGQKVFHYIPQKAFRIIIFIILITSSVYLLLEPLFS